MHLLVRVSGQIRHSSRPTGKQADGTCGEALTWAKTA
jgi:hypothetical protein